MINENGSHLRAVSLYSGENFVERFALFESWRVGGVADRDNCDRVDRFAINTQNLTYDSGAEVAHPARAESHLGGCEADMLRCDCRVDVGVVVAILLASPRLRVVATNYYI